MQKENRRHRRFDSLNTVAYFCLDHLGNVVGQGMGRTLNLSQSGILLNVYRYLDDCRQLLIHIGLKEDLIEVRGQAIHCKQQAGVRGYQCGIEFIDLSEESRTTLAKFVAEFEKD